MKYAFVVAVVSERDDPEKSDCFPVGIFTTELAMKQGCRDFLRSADDDHDVVFEAVFVEPDKGMLYGDVENATVFEGSPEWVN